MNKKAFSCLLLLLLACAVRCNVNQAFMQHVKQMMSGAVNAGHLIQSCENHHYYWDWNFHKDQLNAHANVVLDVRWLRNNHKRHLPRELGKMKFMKKTLTATFENNMSSQANAGVLTEVLVAIKEGDSIFARLGIGSATCALRQQIQTIVTQKTGKCNKKTTETKHFPRGHNPQEIKTVLGHLEQQSAQTLYDITRARTGLSGQIENGLEGLYLNECHKLRNFFSEIKYDYIEMEDVPHHELPLAINQGSRNQITDGYIHERIKQIAGSHGRSSFFHAPNDHILFVTSVNRVGNNFLVRMSSFSVPHRLPGGAFAWSVGGWNLERGGRGTNPSVQSILNVFPPLK